MVVGARRLARQFDEAFEEEALQPRQVSCRMWRMLSFRPASPPLPLKHWACLPCSASGRPKRSRSVPFSPKPSTAGSGPGRAVERRCTIVRKTGRRQVQVIAIHFREPQRRNAVPQGTRADQEGVGRHRHRHPSPPRAVQLSADVPLFHDPSRDVPALRDAACAGRRYRDALAGLPDVPARPIATGDKVGGMIKAADLVLDQRSYGRARASRGRASAQKPTTRQFSLQNAMFSTIAKATQSA